IMIRPQPRRLPRPLDQPLHQPSVQNLHAALVHSFIIGNRRYTIRHMRFRSVCILTLSALCALAQTKTSPEKEAAMKADLTGQIDGMKKQAQVMVDSVFSFAELGFQEFETTRYLTGILEKEGFKIERGIAGIPTAWVATWGSGKPVISLGSDIDDIPQASQ